MPSFTIEQTRALVVETLLRCRTGRGNAESVARALIAAEKAGQGGHGMRRLPSYAEQALAGKVDGNAKPTATRPAAAVLSVDAAHGFAYPALDLAIAELPAIAREHGLALATISRSHHCGVAGVIVEELAREGLVALLFANTPAAMAPAGGSRALFGTNPIAFACPRVSGDPVVVDVSLSKVARGKIMAAKQAGQSIPEGWALDANGQPTTDPAAALSGTMLPIGDAKGTALALMVEVLAAGLTRSTFAADATSFLDARGGPPGTGQLILAIDAQALGGAAMLAHCEGLFSAIENDGEARLPGARRSRIAENVDRDGIEIDADLLSLIETTGTQSTGG